jgi:hypothetical protein
MFKLGLYFQTLDLIKTKVLLDLGLKAFVVWSKKYKTVLKKLFLSLSNLIFLFIFA